MALLTGMPGILWSVHMGILWSVHMALLTEMRVKQTLVQLHE